MKKLFTAIGLTIALGVGGLQAADNKDDQQSHFKRRVEQINDAAKDKEVMQLAIKHISVETGVPADKVRVHHERHPNMGAAGLLLANVMAAETKKPPATFLNERQTGDSWLAIAKEHKVGIEKLTVRLDNVWKAIAPAAKKSGN